MKIERDRYREGADELGGMRERGKSKEREKETGQRTKAFRFRFLCKKKRLTG
jgi:hypothetical protein